MMFKWIKRLFKRTKLNKEEKVVTVDYVLEWTVFIEEFGA